MLKRCSDPMCPFIAVILGYIAFSASSCTVPPRGATGVSSATDSSVTPAPSTQPDADNAVAATDGAQRDTRDRGERITVTALGMDGLPLPNTRVLIGTHGKRTSVHVYGDTLSDSLGHGGGGIVFTDMLAASHARSCRNVAALKCREAHPRCAP